jgi:hypothetical protein
LRSEWGSGASLRQVLGASLDMRVGVGCDRRGGGGGGVAAWWRRGGGVVAGGDGDSGGGGVVMIGGVVRHSGGGGGRGGSPAWTTSRRAGEDGRPRRTPTSPRSGVFPVRRSSRASSSSAAATTRSALAAPPCRVQSLLLASGPALRESEKSRGVQVRGKAETAARKEPGKWRRAE